MESVSSLITLALIAGIGYLFVAFVYDRFIGKKTSPEEDEATLYAQALGVRRNASVQELELALERAYQTYSGEAVAQMSAQDRQVAALRLQSAQRAFHHLLARSMRVREPH
jgi:hypothetical protein